MPHDYKIIEVGLQTSVYKDASSIDTNQITKAKEFINTYMIQSKHKNANHSSYAIKEKMERALNTYTSNGAVIKAFDELGYKTYPIKDSINCHFNWKWLDSKNRSSHIWIK